MWGMKWIGIVILTFSFLNAAFEFDYSGSRSDALANAYTSIAEGVEGVIFNPAATATLNGREISAYYNYLYSSLGAGLKGLTLQYGPLKILNRKFAVSILRLSAQFDNETYAENTIVLSHGFPVSSNLYAGFNLNIYHLQNPMNLGNATTFGVDFGVLAKIYDRWSLGFSIHNLNNPRLTAQTGTEELPFWIQGGVSFRGGRYSLTSFELRESKDYPVRISIGEEVKVLEFAKLRAGLMSEGSLFRFTSGVGLKVRKFQFDYALWYNPDLPLTHTVTFKFVP